MPDVPVALDGVLKILIRSVDPVPETQKAKARMKPAIKHSSDRFVPEAQLNGRIASCDESRGTHWNT